jgi:hypothetical protein
VTGSGLTGGSYTVKVDTGRIDLRHDTAPANVVATVNTGDVEVSVPAGVAYAVSGSHDGGDVEVDRDPASPYRIQMNVSTGRADVRRT